MNEQLLTLYDFTLTTIERLMEDVADDQVAHLPSPGINPPGWILGHLALVDEMALKLLGQPDGTLPEEWKAEFGAGSTPEPIGGSYPPKDELLATLRETHGRVAEAVKVTDLAAITDPNPIKPLVAAGLSTKGDLLGHILSTHIAMHAGHLSNWRRQMGHPPLF